MFTADQLVAHLVGDYILQSDWMAREKSRKSLAALLHVIFYTLPFLLITQEPATLAVIAGTHFVIDRWRLARYLIYAKNRLWPGGRRLNECSKYGFPEDTPVYLAQILFLIVDAVMHIVINGLAIYYLG